MTSGLSGASLVYASILERRYACKRFDPSRRVGESERRFILEAGRLSPSSFGLEPWLFVFADSAEKKEGFYRACFSQDSLRTADFVVAIAVRRSDQYAPDSPFIAQRAERFPGGLPAFLDEYRSYWEFLESSGRLEHWARAQGYIACSNMMNAATAVGIDSCAIEGYSEPEIIELTTLSPDEWMISLVAAFGFRSEDRRGKIREPLSSIVLRI